MNWSAGNARAELPSSDFVQEHCAACHAGKDAAANLDFAALVRIPITEQSASWERAVRKLQTRQMPPAGEAQPGDPERRAFLNALTASLDSDYFESPQVGPTEALRRLNRTEYQNSVRDLLGVQIDASTFLPPDESSHGFDNITVSDLTPTYLSRAISAAQKISHLALGAQRRGPTGETFRVRPDITQEDHVEGLPIGTRGGTLVHMHFAQSGEYEITVRLARDRNEEVEGLYEAHELEILLDRERLQLFTVEPPPGRKDFSGVDQHLHLRTHVAAGSHAVGITFLKKSTSLLETKRQPYSAHYNMHRHPRLGPAVYEVSVTGPFPKSDSDARPATTANQPRTLAHSAKEGSAWLAQELLDPPAGASAEEEIELARQQLRNIMRRAYRRPIDESDLQEPMEFFSAHREADGFRAAIEHALAAVLVSPHFLFKFERTPTGVSRGESYRLSDVELASRLSFFLWSSLPDERLLDLAEQNELSKPEVLAEQVERMLRDHRASSLVDNFAEQWLHLRNLESITPDLRLYPDFDDNLRQAFRQETKLCFENVICEDRSVLDLLRSDVTFLNERLAKHYGIAHVYGSRFRRVELPANTHRGGLLRQGSILTVTSYATRTSPVVRGHWVLKNIVGSPPPPPPADVPALKDNSVATNLSMRERLAEHRAQVACAGCHNLMDPVGFALENFDAVGRWRESEDGEVLDVSGGLAGMPDFVGVEGLEHALLQQPELFVSTLTEKLMTFAVGRGIDADDAPAVRRIVEGSAKNGYSFSSIIHGITSSPPFQMRSAQ